MILSFATHLLCSFVCKFKYRTRLRSIIITYQLASYGSPKWSDPMGEESQQEVAFQNIATWLMEDVNKHGGCTQTEKDQCTCI